MSPKTKTRYVCSECGAVSPKWAGQCGDCGAWNSLVEEVAAPTGPGGPFPSDVPKTTLLIQSATLVK